MPARPEPAAATATALDSSDESATTALYRAAIGPVRCDYYLPVFARFDAADRAGPSWNWAACLGTLNWMVFRQLWGPALVYAAVVAGLALVALGIGRLSGAFSGIATLCLLVALATLSFLVPGFFGNALFFAHSRKRMARALSATDTVTDACVLLNRQSTTRQRSAWLALGNAALAGAAIAVYLAPPPALPLAGIARQPADTRNAGARQAGAAATPAGRAASANATVPGQPVASRAVSAPPATVSAPPAALAAPPAAVSATSAASATPTPAVKPPPSVTPTPVAKPPPSVTPTPVAKLAPSVTPTPVAKLAPSVTPTPATASVAPAPSVPSVPPAPTAAASGTVIAGLTRNPSTPANQSPGQDHQVRRDQPTSVASAPTVVSVAPAAASPVPLAPAPAPTLATATAPAPRYFINVGLFAQDGNAQRAHAKLLAAGLAAFTQELDTPSGKRTRVRAGPFDNRAQADDAAGKIRALELEAMVFRQ